MKKHQANTAVRHSRRTRVSTQLPTFVNGVQGVTRDVSTSGLYILQGSESKIGSLINFWVDLDTPGGKLKLCCEGEVVRVEKVDDLFGIGIKVLSQVIKSDK